MIKVRSLKTLPLDGGALPFHFINTVYAWRGENLHEYLNDYKEFMEWCRKIKILSPKILSGLENSLTRDARATEDAFKKIRNMRLLLYQLFSGVAASGANPAVLNDYSAALQDALSHYAWMGKKNKMEFRIKEDTTALLLPLYIILKESHDLLLAEDSRRIKECPLCGWIFLDVTKNTKRRWCSPSTCGSVEKTSKYYQKVKIGRVRSRPDPTNTRPNTAVLNGK